MFLPSDLDIDDSGTLECPGNKVPKRIPSWADPWYREEPH